MNVSDLSVTWGAQDRNTHAHSMSLLTLLLAHSLTHSTCRQVQSEANEWVVRAVTEFGASGVSPKLIVEHAKSCLDNSNPAVRTSGVR